MDVPGFERAEYVEPQTIDAYPSTRGSISFAKACAFGLGAAAAGSLGYAIVGLSGWMVSIVAIGIGWLIGKAMMTGSSGIGGRRYQVVAVVRTYFSVSCGHLLDILWIGRVQIASLGNHALWLFEICVRLALLGPFLALSNPFNGAIGLLILFFGMRTAWQMAAGGPGWQGGSVTTGSGTKDAGIFGR